VAAADPGKLAERHRGGEAQNHPERLKWK
jgi:hypothetical protein